VEATQRYCVVCGTRRRHVADPAARFMSAATAQARTQARSERAAVTSRARRPAGLGTALVIALIPLGVGLGVLLGRASNNQDGKLLAAIEARRQQVDTVTAAVGTSTAPSTVAAATGTVSSSFTLASGFTIELSTLPAGSLQSAATAAEAAARAKGATRVGLVSIADDAITPTPAGSFVIYSGAFPTRAGAQHALAKLKHSFPNAVVISVKGTTARGGKASANGGSGATQATGYKPTQKSLAQGAAVAGGVAKKTGKSYVGAQRGLPSVVSVP
jgi:hypothetical protein